MPIRTPRLLIRPPQAFDGKAFYEAKAESMAEVKPWMEWAQYPQTPAGNEAFCREKQAGYIARKDMTFLVFNGEKLVASAGFPVFNWQKRHFEIAYWVRTCETGKGYATEITAALVHYAFNALAAKRVSLYYDVLNEGSAAVAKKVGFIKEGVLRNGSLIGTRTESDLVVCSLLPTDACMDIEVSW